MMYITTKLPRNGIYSKNVIYDKDNHAGNAPNLATDKSMENLQRLDGVLA